MYLVSMGYTKTVCCFMCAVLPFHWLCCFIFVGKLNYGLLGVAWSNDFTALITVTIQIVYLTFLPELKKAWFRPSKNSFKNIRNFMRNAALPGVLMKFLDHVAIQIVVIMASYTGNYEMIAANTIVVTIAILLFRIP